MWGAQYQGWGAGNGEGAVNISWRKNANVMLFSRTLLIVLAVAVCGVTAQDMQTLLEKAEAGDASAQFNIGLLYEEGWGVPEDDAEAVKWYRKAAETGHVQAQFNLGVMHDTGERVPEDGAEAVKWYRKAAEQGYIPAQFKLGVMYRNGWGVPEDDAEAMKWFRKAAVQGNAIAQCRLGTMYDTGEGVLEDDVAAYAWYSVAVASGNALAQFLFIDGKKGTLTPTQLENSQAMAREILERIQKQKAE